ncbi:serum amyloid p-component-like [Lynx pardinus]|uniref:Pentraxin family member n=1 Tax=Lynx pardinus TaxID=191816 RepID=A0A485PCJ9_LYNPA|nr:serum amyloid p-component-like [Lynx pardinus]
MDKLLLWVSALANLLGVFAQTGTVVGGKVFVFPRESSIACVTLTPKLEDPLKNSTFLSYNAPGKDSGLLVFKDKVGSYSPYIGRTKATFKVTETAPSPVHICTSWEPSTGITEFWVNGEPLVKKGLKQGYTVGGHPKMVLDAYGGGLQKAQSLVGEIGDSYTWDSVLSPEQILLVQQGSHLNPNVLGWCVLTDELKGHVVIKPLVWS